MASSRAALKSIKSLIDAGQYEKAATEAQGLVAQDDKNYNAFMLLGFASEKLGRLEATESALKSAAALKGQDAQPWKGLITLYEKQGASRLDQYHNATHRLAQIYTEQEDRMQCQNVVDKYEGFAKRHGTRAQYRRALELILPTSDIYSMLEGRVHHPSLTYKRILESSQAEEKEWITNEIGQRRTRLGAKIDLVTREVRYEAISKFRIEEKYQSLIDWTIDDTTRHELEEALLVKAYENLQCLPGDLKPAQRDKVLSAANGMVIIKHPFAFAWNVALEWVDAEDLAEWDVGILGQYVDLFPEQGLAKVLRAFLGGSYHPSPQEDPTDPVATTSDPLSEADQLIMMAEGLDDCKKSSLAHRIVAQTYLTLNEHHSAAENSRKAQRIYLDLQNDFALDLQNSLDGVNLTLANALIHYQSPRHHGEARNLFDDILARKPTLTGALLGIGLMLEEDEDYGQAAKFLGQALNRDPSNLLIGLEHAWSRALDYDLKSGLDELETTLERIQQQQPVDLHMKSKALYRIAYCRWHLNPSPAARKDKTGPYRFLIEAMKADPVYAPPYTLLGFYFLNYGKSKKRAKQALQKAFELSVSELGAAEQLSSLFANNGEWDLVELVARRVVDSGKARPAPGSKKKAVSWPYAALGIVQMTRQQFSQSIVSFQAALRIAPQDYHSWIGLGESYHNSGRFVAAARAFRKAESLDHNLPPSECWFANYMLANVQREVGAFGDAIRDYEAVLEIVQDEFGVLIALLQTYTESALAKLSQGLFGHAVELSYRAIDVAERIAAQRVDVFNLWKAVGDAFSILGHAKALSANLHLDKAISLLRVDLDKKALTILSDTDKLQIDDVGGMASDLATESATQWHQLSIFAHKRAIHATSNDTHAQAVAWYNLGWAEHAAFALAGPARDKKANRFLRASVKSFKKAIELEAGNAEFWNALGVVTLNMNVKVSQHSFVRSLYLNDHSAKAWTNLGVLYLINHDTQLANEAFTRAQSADPEFAAAWIGQGLLATLLGKTNDAQGLFTHAFEIADASSIPAKRHYAMTAFDHLTQNSSISSEIQDLLRPLFALRQLHVQEPGDDAGSHLLALYAERVGEYGSGVTFLDKVCINVEREFERSEASDQLAKFVQAKADLARLQLSSGDYRSAVENAETALDLSSEEDLGSAYNEDRPRWRLSALITAGLAYSHQKLIDQSIKMFQTALEESDHAPDIACMLAQVLWAKGGRAEREAARSQLFSSVEKHPDHVLSVSLLAVIGLLDGDDDVLEAVADDLKALRMNDGIGVTDKIKISRVLAGITSRKNTVTGSSSVLSNVADAMSGIMLAPGQPQGWLELSQATGDEYAAKMALQSAKNQVPPRGGLSAEGLAMAYARSGMKEDIQTANMFAPWLQLGVEMYA